MLNEFFFDEKYDDARIARNRFLEMVVLFESEDERSDFEHILARCKGEFEKRLSGQPVPYGPERLPDTCTVHGRDMLESQMRAVPVVKSMLADYRYGQLSGIMTSRDW